MRSLKEVIGLIRRFVEDYHEKNDEEYLFTRFNKADKLVNLIRVLCAQRQAGRQLTTRIEEKLIPARFSQAAERAQLAAYLHAYTRMYRAHAAREDTVLYPAFRSWSWGTFSRQGGQALRKRRL